MITLKNIFFLLTILILIPNYYALGAVSVSIPDTMIKSGVSSKIKIQVTGTIDISPINSIKIRFKYNSGILDIAKVFGSPNYAMTDNFPQITNINSTVDSAIFEVFSKTGQTVTNGIICELETEGLASEDSLAYIKPVQIFINDTEITNANLKQGKIIVNDAIIVPVYPEGLAQNRPNPFLVNDLVSVPFFINKNTKVQFSLFYIDGEFIQDFGVFGQMQNFMITNESGLNLNYSHDMIFSHGSYFLKFTPNFWEIPSGKYFLTMKTQSFIYKINLLYCK
ncbi:MAG: hypothetical protein NT007_19435 [Candidatus Kapabacteria bacterium]|nr:hypothetical protein [Candidatus Kapabacteria bacterium]